MRCGGWRRIGGTKNFKQGTTQHTRLITESVFHHYAGWCFSFNKTEGLNMLVLSRKLNDRIKIGEHITLVVLDIRQDKVRIGIDAPKDMPVHRQEVFDAIKTSQATTGRESGSQE